MLKLELVKKASVGLNACYLFKINDGEIQSRCVASLKAKELFNSLFLDLEGVYYIIENTYGFEGEEIDRYIELLVSNQKEIDSFSKIFYEEYSKIKCERNVPRLI